MLSADIPLLGVDPELFKSPVENLAVVGNERKPIGHPMSEYGTSGYFEVRNGEVALSVIYDHPDALGVPRSFFNNFDLDSDQFRVLQRLVLSDKNGHGLSLLSLPEGWTSLFSIEPSQTEGLDFASPSYKTTVVATEDILSPAGITVHLHEIGHAIVTDFSLEKEVRAAFNKRTRTLSPSERDLLLAHEANAWAYAFNKLAPFLTRNEGGTFYVGDLASYAYGSCLGSYETVMEQLSQGVVQLD